MNQDYLRLAQNLVKHSCAVQKGQRVLIEQACVDPEFVVALIEQVHLAGGIPFVHNFVPEISKALMLCTDTQRAQLLASFDLPKMQAMDTYISIGGSHNVFENSDVPTMNLQTYAQYYSQPVHIEERVNNTNWVILRWPTPAFAQSAGLSTNAFKDMFFKVCTLDYGKMSAAMDALVQRLQRTNFVRITAPGTDISFSIAGVPAIKCAGKNNIPDGEVFTAPIKNSVNGTITYNIPTLENGTRFDNICFVVQDGKIISATAGNQTQKLNQILDTDEGARFFGEFALGVNPHITQPILDILFDEKMCGSIHLTPGSCYTEAPNGNQSAVHWDLVLCQLPQFGGGEIFFDGELVRKDGRFVTPDLLALNPENLI